MYHAQVRSHTGTDFQSGNLNRSDSMEI